MMLGVSAGLSPDPQDPLRYGFRSGSLLRSRGGDRRTTGSAPEPSVDPRSRCPRLEPTGFELRAFIGECLGDLLHDLGEQTVGLLDRASGLVDEARLNVQPPRPEGLGWTGRKRAECYSHRSSALAWRARPGPAALCEPSGGARTWSSRLARAARPTPPTDASRVGRLRQHRGQARGRRPALRRRPVAGAGSYRDARRPAI